MSHELDDFLLHYGVKGMKWGVRRKRSSSKKSKSNKDSVSQRLKDEWQAMSPRQRRLVGGYLVVSSAAIGASVAYDLSKAVITPDNIRRGKNVMQAIKRSPFRYADASKMNNVINMPVKYLR